ncbi:MAG: FAD-dependent oxidoreductase [Deltaproteobacteria bacterium]|jgi:mycofactocin system FadH/OYE family oxidoreductase 2|nr:FAD-dependent oxidoreductase [Deltaproteobacteria bacterium]
MFDNLFTPLSLGSVTLSNRISLLAHRTNFARSGRLNERHIAYYRRRAQGGCGLIILGELALHPDDRPWETLIEVHRPEVVADFQKLTDAVHQFDTRIFAQLNHSGFQSSGYVTRKAILGPSAVADIVFGETCKPMEPEDMTEIGEAYSQAALRVKQGGFDGLEIDMGPESLLRQFLSPISNHRGDEYGGSLENRMRFPLKIVATVRETVGHDFAIGVCLCADEKFWGGIAPEESVPMAQALEATGAVDFINVAVGTYYNLHLIMPSMHIPFGFTIDAAEQIKGGIGIPVMAGHQIGFPAKAERLIADGKADMVGYVRALISDPDMVKKAREGRVADIRYCVKDNKGCVGRINQSKALGCIQNPRVGYEPLSGDQSWPPIRQKKKVVVVGAGPSGMETARVAHERGHDVTIYEKADTVGGQVKLIGMRPGRGAMQGVIRYLKHMLTEGGVPIRTGVMATAELILEQAPDAVVVATGSVPVAKPFPGDYGPPAVLNGWDVIQGTYPVGEKVLFVDEDGGHHAMATAELLAEQGKQVDMVTGDLFIGIELAPRGELYLGRQRLLQQNVTFRTDLDILEINTSDGRLRVKARDIYTNESILFEDYDTVVLDVGNTVDDQLYHQLKGRVKEVYRTGDCVAPRGIDMAIFEGRRVGEQL